MTENTETLLLWIVVIAGSGIVILALVVGAVKGLRGKRSAAVAEDDFEEPTAPISPMIEMARSPHDRHRDMEAGQAVVDQIENLEIIIKSSKNLSKDQLVNQLQIFRGGFGGLLSSCYFEEFVFESGTVVDLDIRRQIVVVEGDSEGDQTIIDETILCGFAYRYKDDEPVIVRKAEVAIR